MKNYKKAFTLVELLVVIAILAILATAAIVGYSSYTKKAHLSNDKTLVKLINDFLIDDEVYGVPNTMYDAKEQLLNNQHGIDISAPKISTQGYHIGYDVKQNRCVLLKSLTGTDLVEAPDGYVMGNPYDIFVPVDHYTTDCIFSQYLNKNATDVTVTTDKGLDAGDCATLTTVNYTNTEVSKDVVIRTNSDATTLFVNAPLDNIKHYGTAGIVNLQKVATSSYYEYGVSAFIELNIGRVVLTKTSDVEVINISKKDENSYNNPIIADGGVLEENMPDIISRDQVNVTDASGKTELVKVEKLDNNGNVLGTVEQIYAYANGTAGTTEKTNTQNSSVESDLGYIVLDSNNNAGEKAYSINQKNEAKDEVAPIAFTSEVLANEEYKDCTFRIGNVGYNTLTEINNTVNSSCTVYMMKDYTHPTTIEYLQNIDNCDVVLDLGGHALTTASYIDVYNGGGTVTIRNGKFIGNARIYISDSNVHLILKDIEMERTLGTSNKYIMCDGGKTHNTIEVVDCNIIANNKLCEYFIGDIRDGQKVIIENTTVNIGEDQFILWENDYNSENECYIELRGTSASMYSVDNLAISANYTISNVTNGVRYTLCEDKENWSTHAATSFANLDTTNKLLSIGTAAELALFANNVNSGNNYAGYTVSLSSDINLSLYEWIPIGNFDSSKGFKGIFDGNNYKVTGVSIGSGASNRGVGFFGSALLGSEIKNLEVNGEINTSKAYAGGIVGHGYTVITNCKFVGNISGNHSVGGILGSGFGTISNCSVSGSVFGQRWVGGIIGNAQESSVSTDCVVSADVTAIYCYDFEGSNAGAGAFYGLATRTSTYNANCSFTGTLKEAGIVKTNQFISDYIDN